jgi:hypothetical protein
MKKAAPQGGPFRVSNAKGQITAPSTQARIFDTALSGASVRSAPDPADQARIFDTALSGASVRSAPDPADQARIFDTTPAPTVRPPSRMAKRRPSSIAMGAISSTVNFRLSPGITISVPSGSSTVPVTSVVRK